MLDLIILLLMIIVCLSIFIWVVLFAGVAILCFLEDLYFSFKRKEQD